MISLASVATGLVLFLRFVVPQITPVHWNDLDKELSETLKPLHHELASNNISAAEAGNCFNKILQSFFSSKPELFMKNEEPKQFFRRKNKTLIELRREKNKLRTKAFRRDSTTDDRKRFYDCLRTYDFMKKQQDINSENRNANYEEKKYRSNFWTFSKNVVNDCLYSKPQFPTFSKETADKFFTERYENPTYLDPTQLNWFPYIPVTLNSEFNLDSIKPKDIKNILKAKSSTSAPGPDGILYGLLKNLPSTHHFMATLFSKILVSGTPPSSWSDSKITLIHKKQSTDIPSNFRMIALASCVGKIYHQVLAERSDGFIKSNKLIDTTYQKAFLSGKNGCVEHNQVLHEIIRHSKSNNRTVHITWFDLEDAFGSVPHHLIELTLKRNNFPPSKCKYISNLYSSLNGTVVCDNWQSKNFKFKKGIFQGDPLSPLIFILCFNPIIQDLDSNLQHGYEINGNKFISSPFADDFCLISRNKRTHQRLVSRISKLTKTMGLKLKPSKCRSLSIVSGKPTAVEFNLDESKIPTLEKEPHKFLGSLITFNNTASDIFTYLHDIIKSGLENIDKSLIRNEYKLKIYCDYFLPSLRFHLTVNDTTSTHLQQLDALADRFIKKWSGLPHPATLAFVHMPKGLNIKSISSLYHECHTNAYISSRCKGDDKVQLCLDSQLERESSWSRKKSQIVQSNQILESINENYTESTLKQKQKKAKDIERENSTEIWHSHVKDLVVQGKFLDLISAEESNFDWKSVVFNLPTRVSKFLMNSVSDTLNTKANLKRWGKCMSTKCSACGNHETLHHILNNCSKFLEQGRYTWRHNNILSYIFNLLKSSINPTDILNCDLEKEKSSFTTVPLQCTVTNLIPDLCLFTENEDGKFLTILELTVPFELNIDSAHSRKSNKYSSLIIDIQNNNVITKFIALEIGSRGYINSENLKRLKDIHKLIKNDISFKTFKNTISKIAIVSSFAIFNARNDPSWDNYPTLMYN